MRNSSKTKVVFDQNRIITPLEYVTALASEPIEAISKGALQPAHAFDQIRLGRFQRQVVVVRHENITMHQPSRPLTNLIEARFKSLLGSICYKNTGPIVASVDDMVQRTRINHS